MATNEENLLSIKEALEESPSEQAAANVSQQNPSQVHIPHWEALGCTTRYFLEKAEETGTLSLANNKET